MTTALGGKWASMLAGAMSDGKKSGGNNQTASSGMAGKLCGMFGGGGKKDGGMLSTLGFGGDPEKARAFDDQAKQAIKSTVRMFSGCRDSQTSADVSNVASFGLPPVSDQERAGGACTNALLSTLNETSGNLSYGDLLVKMQKVLTARKYTQVPQLSSARQVDLKTEPFSFLNKNKNGKTRALLIGINYYGQSGELAGCVNDVKMMKRAITQRGFSDAKQNMRVLTDDRDSGQTDGQPTTENIVAGMEWLVQGAKSGDSLFLHYSGHGGSVPDENGDEEDGKDETLIPTDYQSKGQLTDDTVFGLLVAPLPEGASLVCIFDCCHSGTILDLPYMFYADAAGAQALESGQVTSMQPNPGFNMQACMAMVTKVGKGLFSGNKSAMSVLNKIEKFGSKRQNTGGASGGKTGGGGMMSMMSGLL